MENQQNLSSTESLQIINSMIAEARKSFSKTAVFFLLWGIVLGVAGVGEFILIKANFSAPYVVWPVFSLIGGVVAGIIGKNQSVEKGNTTLMDRVMFALWVSFFITLVLFIVGCVLSKINPGSFIIVLTGFPTITTGYLLKFKPLMLGGLSFWILGILAFFVPNLYLPLFYTFSMLLGYIIPGLLLRKAERDGQL